MKTKQSGLTATQLKYLMAGLMVLDHLSILPNSLPANWIIVFHMMTRCVAVCFAYLVVEGYLYTHNRLGYNLRLFIAGVVMWLGNQILNSFLLSKNIYISNNIFLTLACGLGVLNLWFGFSKKQVSTSPLAKTLGGLLLLLGIFLTEGGLVVLPFILLTYLFREKVSLRNALYGVWAVCLFWMSYQAYPTWSETLSMLLYNSDWLFITVLPFLKVYNGERGKTTRWNQYFFYVFYPLHIWLLALLAYSLG